MSTSPEQEPLADDLFAGFASIQPSAEAATRAVAKTRLALNTSGSPAHDSEKSESVTRHMHGAVSQLSRGRRFVRGLIAASIVVVVLSVFWLRTPSNWAQVQEALNSKPWIHLRAKLDDGTTRENWISLPQKKSAFRVGPTARYIDIRNDVQFDYEKSRGTVIRSARRPADSPDSIMALFEQLMQGKSPNVDEVERARVLETRSRKVVEAGKEWLDVELTLQSIEPDPALKSVARLEFRVDPATNLPRTMTLALIAPGQNEPEGGQRRLVYEIDYPADGPADIYGMGIPREVKLDDRVPSDDAHRAMKAIAAGRHDFDPYFAVVFHGPSDTNFSSPPFAVIWRRGNQLRAETCYPVKPLVPYAHKPADVDDLTWWKQQLKHFEFIPVVVCDGKNSYTAEITPADQEGRQRVGSWKFLSVLRKGESLGESQVSPVRHLIPEFFSYPELFLNDEMTVQLADATDGQPNGSLLTLTHTRNLPGAFLRQRLWLDAERGFAVTRHNVDQLSVTREEALAQQQAVEDERSMEDMRRTPKGLWYPSRVVRRTANEPKEPGAARELIQQSATSFLLDFNAQLPDSLFTKKERTTGF